MSARSRHQGLLREEEEGGNSDDGDAVMELHDDDYPKATFRNVSRSINVEVRLFRPLTESELIFAVQKNVEQLTPCRLRVVGAGHAEGPLCVPDIDPTRDVMIDLGELKTVEIRSTNDSDRSTTSPTTADDDAQNDDQNDDQQIDDPNDDQTLPVRRDVYVRVQPGATFFELLPLLEDHSLTLPNIPSCLDRTLGGAFATAAHGSGAFANFCDAVLSVRLLDAQAKISEYKSGTPEFNACAGGLGSTGIILSLDIRVLPLVGIHQDLHAYRGMQEIQQWAEQQIDAFSSEYDISGNYDRGWFLPITETMWWSTRTSNDSLEVPASNERMQNFINRLWGRMGAMGIKGLEVLRHIHLLDSSKAQGMVNKATNAYIREMPTVTTLYRSDLTLNAEARRMARYFDECHECAMLVPVQYAGSMCVMLCLVLQMAGGVFVSIDKAPTHLSEAVEALVEAGLAKAVEAAIRRAPKNVVSVAPIRVELVPATNCGLLAPSLRQNMVSFAIPWFGKSRDALGFYTLMHVVQYVAESLYNAKFDFSSHNPVVQPTTNSRDQLWLQRHRLRYGTDWEQARSQALAADPNGIFRNDFVARWFDLL